jgi:hypothetical protein
METEELWKEEAMQQLEDAIMSDAIVKAHYIRRNDSAWMIVRATSWSVGFTPHQASEMVKIVGELRGDLLHATADLYFEIVDIDVDDAGDVYYGRWDGGDTYSFHFYVGRRFPRDSVHVKTN